jgi:hypothetical protein
VVGFKALVSLGSKDFSKIGFCSYFRGKFNLLANSEFFPIYFAIVNSSKDVSVINSFGRFNSSKNV